MKIQEEIDNKCIMWKDGDITVSMHNLVTFGDLITRSTARICFLPFYHSTYQNGSLLPELYSIR